MIQPGHYRFEVNPRYLDLVTELRRQEDQSAPEATFEDVGRYAVPWLERGAELHRSTQLSEWVAYWGMASTELTPRRAIHIASSGSSFPSAKRAIQIAHRHPPINYLQTKGLTRDARGFRH